LANEGGPPLLSRKRREDSSKNWLFTFRQRKEGEGLLPPRKKGKGSLYPPRKGNRVAAERRKIPLAKKRKRGEDKTISCKNPESPSVLLLTEKMNHLKKKKKETVEEKEVPLSLKEKKKIAEGIP